MPLLDHVSFDVPRGEILAVAGVQGNGQTELAEVILGLQTPDSGVIRLEDADITRAKPRESLEAGVGFIPEDRSTDGIIASFSIADNLVLDQFAPRLSRLLAPSSAVRLRAMPATRKKSMTSV